MRIWIVTMDDPIYTVDFIKRIIDNRQDEIIGLTIAKGSRLKINKKRSKAVYLLSLLLIMGIPYSFYLSIKTILYKMLELIYPKSRYTLSGYAFQHRIPVSYTNNPNSQEFCEMLGKQDIDLIINQSQFILKKRFISIPKIGVLNRHNALLPKNKGRLTPFWVLYKKETETGVSIHFVNEKIDEGNIIVQEKYKVSPNATFREIVQKNYSIAHKAMINALDLLDSNSNYSPITNDYEESYNTVPTLKEAINFRLKDPIGLLKI